MLKPAAATAQAELEMVTLDQLAPRDHLLRLIDTRLRFDFIRETSSPADFADSERDREAQMELADAYGLLSEFWDTIENSMEGDHPAKERLERWLCRFETASALQSGE